MSNRLNTNDTLRYAQNQEPLFIINSSTLNAVGVMSPEYEEKLPQISYNVGLKTSQQQKLSSIISSTKSNINLVPLIRSQKISSSEGYKKLAVFKRKSLKFASDNAQNPLKITPMQKNCVFYTHISSQNLGVQGKSLRRE